MPFVSHSWLNDNVIEYREYQEKIARTALTGNTLCVIPTGLGKTNISALVAAHRLDKNLNGKILFLAPTRPLVSQHKKNFEKYFKAGLKMKVITGEDRPENRVYLYRDADIIFSTPQCVTGDTNIFIRGRGIVKIGDFVESFPLKECIYNKKGFCANVDEYTLGLEHNKISAVRISRAWKLPADTIYKIQTELKNTIKCTPEHPLLTINTEGKIEWKKSEDLDTNTWIAMPKELSMPANEIDLYSLIRNAPLRLSEKNVTVSILKEHKKLRIKRGKISRFYHNTMDAKTFFEILDTCKIDYPDTIKVTNKTGRSCPITVSKHITPKLCYLVGAMLGDGHIGNTKSKGKEVVFSAIANKEVIEKFRQYAFETFGILPKLDLKKGIIYYSTAMGYILNALGIPFGKKANIIRVPNYMFEIPENHISKFLGGLFDTDGHASKHSITVVSTINRDFAEDVKWLLLRLGIVSYLYKSGKNESIIRGKKYETHHCYNVVISGESKIKKFIELCDPDKVKCKKVLQGLFLIKRHYTRSKDILPVSGALKKAYIEHRENGGETSSEVLIAYHQKELSTTFLSNILTKLNSSKAREIENLLSLPIRWVKIKSIEKINSEAWVYDLTVENSHNFIGNFLVNHNTVQNDLKNNSINLQDFILCIFDEAHRSVGNYAYPFVAKKYMEQSKSPLILALTASPGGHRAKINEVKAKLFIKNVEIRTRDDSDVKPYVQHLSRDWIKVELPTEMQTIRNYLEKIRRERISKLLSWKIISYPRPSKSDLLKLQNELARKKTGFGYAAMSVIAEVIKIDHSLMLLETQCLHSLQKYFDKMLNEKSKASQRLLANSDFKNAMRLTTELLTEGKEHPKINALREFVVQELNDKDARIIIFAQLRDTIEKIRESLSGIKGAAPVEFIGQAKKKGKGLSQKEQLQILNEFGMGFHNILIASQIGEEGLDIVETSAVIFYEPVPSAIRSIQRAGRTARTKPGKVIVLMTKDSRDEAYYWSGHQKERKMHGILYGMQRSQKFSEKKGSLKDFVG